MPERKILGSARKDFQAAILIFADGEQVDYAAERSPRSPGEGGRQLLGMPERSVITDHKRVELTGSIENECRAPSHADAEGVPTYRVLKRTIGGLVRGNAGDSGKTRNGR